MTSAARSHRAHDATLKTWSLFPAVVAVCIAGYGAFMWGWTRPEFIHHWREGDTLTIARHLAEPGASIFYPRIDWGGAGPGYVEAEFQLYTWFVSLLLKLFGDAEWPGQAASMLFVLGAAWVVFKKLSVRYGAQPAAWGLAAMLASRGVVQASTAVQPESLCLLLFAVAWFAFLEFVDSGSRRALSIYAVFGAVAMLVKPTAAQIGIASFIALALGRRDLLRRKEVWLAWIAMVAVFGLYLLQARSVYLESGNTFGILSGGDSKSPRLEHLLMPKLYLSAAVNSVLWGVGPVGAAAVLAAFIMRKGSDSMVGFIAGIVVWTLLTLRYSSHLFGNHYHLLGSVLGAQAVAHVSASLPEARWRRPAAAGLVCVLAVVLVNSVKARQWIIHPYSDGPQIAAGLALRRHVQPSDLVIVRSHQVHYDPFWKTVTNWQDPRVFFLSRTRGWPVASDTTDADVLEAARVQGARFYVEPEERAAMPEVDAWLARTARIVETTEYKGKIYALSGPAQPTADGRAE